MRFPFFVITVLAGAGLISAACSSSDAAPPATLSVVTTPATATSTPPAPAATPTVSSPTTSTTTRVSANNATRAQVQAALEAAGVPNAGQWAREVEEYRPYPDNDVTMAKLRQNLAKYNPGPGVVDKIISALSLP